MRQSDLSVGMVVAVATGRSTYARKAERSLRATVVALRVATPFGPTPRKSGVRVRFDAEPNGPGSYVKGERQSNGDWIVESAQIWSRWADIEGTLQQITADRLAKAEREAAATDRWSRLQALAAASGFFGGDIGPKLIRQSYNFVHSERPEVIVDANALEAILEAVI